MFVVWWGFWVCRGVVYRYIWVCVYCPASQLVRRSSSRYLSDCLSLRHGEIEWLYRAGSSQLRCSSAAHFTTNEITYTTQQNRIEYTYVCMYVRSRSTTDLILAVPSRLATPQKTWTRNASLATPTGRAGGLCTDSTYIRHRQYVQTTAAPSSAHSICLFSEILVESNRGG